MKAVAALLMLVALSFSAVAFFPRDRPLLNIQVGPFPLEPEEPEVHVASAATACAIMMRYQIATPTGLEIQYVGGTCADTELAAIVAASLKVPAQAAAAKVTVGGESAISPIYQCSVNVTWDPIAATVPTILGAGTGCENTAGSALAAAAKAVRCQHIPNTPCR